MENIVLDTSLTPVVEITDVGGDLRITGWDQPQFVAESDEEDSVHFDHDGDRLRLHSDSDLTLRLPHGALVSVRSVGGDAVIRKLVEQPLAVGNIGGDLDLREIAGANLGVVGGDLKIKRVLGDLQVGNVGGDLEAREVGGAVKSGNIGGDLFLQAVGGPIQALAGGDVTLAIQFKPEQEYSLQAGGDFTCRVAPDASVRLALIAGGDITVEVPTTQLAGNSTRKTVTLGAGAAAANLRAGGDLRLTSAGFEADGLGDFDEKFGADFANMAADFGAQIGSQIASQISAHMADFDEQMADLNFVTDPAEAAKIAATARQAAERVQRAGRQQAEAARRRAEKQAEAAQRLAESAQRRAEAIKRKVREEHGRRGWPFRSDPARPPQPPRPPVPPRPSAPAAPAEPVSDEERMLILRMVEQGKISVADAEKLLSALENK